MKACVLSKPAPVETCPLDLVDLPEPVATDEFVTVRVSACGICRTDLHVVEGDLEKRCPSIVPGHQIVGVVDEIGNRVSNLSRADRVGIACLNPTSGVCR